MRTMHTTQNGNALAGKHDSVLVESCDGFVKLGVNTFDFPGASHSWNFSHLTREEARQLAGLLNSAADRTKA